MTDDERPPEDPERPSECFPTDKPRRTKRDRPHTLRSIAGGSVGGQRRASEEGGGSPRDAKGKIGVGNTLAVGRGTRRRSSNPIEECDRITQDVVARLRFQTVERTDKRGRTYHTIDLKNPAAMDAQRAHAVIAALRLRTDLFSMYAVGDKLAEQLAELAALRNEIAKLKAARGEV